MRHRPYPVSTPRMSFPRSPPRSEETDLRRMPTICCSPPVPLLQTYFFFSSSSTDRSGSGTRVHSFRVLFTENKLRRIKRVPDASAVIVIVSQGIQNVPTIIIAVARKTFVHGGRTLLSTHLSSVLCVTQSWACFISSRGSRSGFEPMIWPPLDIAIPPYYHRSARQHLKHPPQAANVNFISPAQQEGLTYNQ